MPKSTKKNSKLVSSRTKEDIQTAVTAALLGALAGGVGYKAYSNKKTVQVPDIRSLILQITERVPEADKPSLLLTVYEAFNRGLTDLKSYYIFSNYEGTPFSDMISRRVADDLKSSDIWVKILDLSRAAKKYSKVNMNPLIQFLEKVSDRVGKLVPVKPAAEIQGAVKALNDFGSRPDVIEIRSGIRPDGGSIYSVLQNYLNALQTKYPFADSQENFRIALLNRVKEGTVNEFIESEFEGFPQSWNDALARNKEIFMRTLGLQNTDLMDEVILNFLLLPSNVKLEYLNNFPMPPSQPLPQGMRSPRRVPRSKAAKKASRRPLRKTSKKSPSKVSHRVSRKVSMKSPWKKASRKITKKSSRKVVSRRR
jgi:hypothetical protein